MSKQSFWCWLRRHRMLVAGYEYAFPFCKQPTLIKPIMVCQCKIADTEVPSLRQQLDWTCSIHGKKMSEHDCLYCCLCFRDLKPEDCHVRDDGKREDVCVPCARAEAKAMGEQ